MNSDKRAVSYPLDSNWCIPVIKEFRGAATGAATGTSNENYIFVARRRSTESLMIENLSNEWYLIPSKELQLYLYRISERWSDEMEREGSQK